MTLTKLSNGMYKSEYGVFYSKRLHMKKLQEDKEKIINLFSSGNRQTKKDAEGLVSLDQATLMIGMLSLSQSDVMARETVTVPFEMSS